MSLLRLNIVYANVVDGWEMDRPSEEKDDEGKRRGCESEAGRRDTCTKPRCVSSFPAGVLREGLSTGVLMAAAKGWCWWLWRKQQVALRDPLIWEVARRASGHMQC